MPTTQTAASELDGNRLFVMCSVLIVIIAGILRFHDLAERSMWYDEAVAANNSRGTLSETIANTRARNSSPIVYPLVLHAAQEITQSAFVVRLPAAIAGTLAVLVLLALSRVGVDKGVAVIAGSILAVSTTQIRYSQETREYALAVFLAALMLYGLLSNLQSSDTKRRVLYISTFIAPLVQYGLVLFGAAVLTALTLATVRQHSLRVAVRRAAWPAILLAVGSVLSYVLTLKYQSRGRSDWWYLKPYLYEGSLYDAPKVLAFVAVNTFGLLKFLTAGQMLIGLAIPAFGFLAYRSVHAPKHRYSVPWTVLALTLVSVAILAGAAVLGFYPYGATRQCLYLAPILALAAAGGYQAVAAGMPAREGHLWFALVLSLVFIAGVQNVRSESPYAEQEDIKRAMFALEHSVQDEDVVYVYPGAIPAVDFYRMGRDNFVYGTWNREDPDAYVREFDELVGRKAGRVWMLFSHVVLGEEGYILQHLATRWALEKTSDATGAHVYVGVRRDTQ